MELEITVAEPALIDNLTPIAASLNSYNTQLKMAIETLKCLQALGSEFKTGALPPQLSADLDQVTEPLETLADEINEKIGQLKDSFDTFFEPLQAQVDTFQEQAETIQEQLDTVGEFAESIDQQAQAILVDYTDKIELALQSLSSLRTDKLLQLEQAISTQVEKLIQQALNSLLRELVPQFETLTQTYLTKITAANQQVDEIHQRIEYNLGKTRDLLEQIGRVLEAAKPVLDSATRILA